MKTQGMWHACAALILTIACVVGSPARAQVSDSVIEASFFQYKNGGPNVPAVKPGMVIAKDNVESVKEYLNPSMFMFIKNGATTLKVAETFDFAPSPKYLEATRKNTDVGFEANGNLKNYISGRPFPKEPDLKDPQAGVKLAWNYQYGRVWGDLGCINPFIWDFKNYETGKVERSIVYDKFCLKRYAFKTTDEPVPEATPNPSGLYRGIYVRVASPNDLKDTQLLIHKYKDDTKTLDAWLYLGFQRRVRRLPTGQLTDAFLGTDIMIEDFEGYEGKVGDVTWTYKGTKMMLTPFWDRSKVPDKGKQHTIKTPEGGTWEFTGFTGKGGCHQAAPFQLRKTYVLEGVPKDPSHPVSKRIHYMDAQTSELGITEIYDRKGDLWKEFIIGWVHPEKGADPLAAGSGADIGDSFSMIDVQAGHCTTGFFRGQVRPDLTPDSTFSLQNMRGSS
ncbi:MAG TPA: DUF1329 domain-containing protein [Vicinamibacterales bacterium]|nr:DUF1329 domain-containing protein [Vicinamibacterales bacterium]